MVLGRRTPVIDEGGKLLPNFAKVGGGLSEQKAETCTEEAILVALQKKS